MKQLMSTFRAHCVSHHKERLRGGSADIEIRWTLSANFGGHYNAYAMVLSDRYLQLNGLKLLFKKIYVV